MKKTLVCLLLAGSLAAQSFAVPLGVKGSSSREMIKGLFQVEGVLAVNGKTALNGLWYVWPNKLNYDKASVLKNNGAGILSWEKELNAGGAAGQIQFNNDGEFAGDSNLSWDQGKRSLSVAGLVSSVTFLQNGVPVSLEGHKHSVSDLSSGILGIEMGGTGSNNGSILASGELKLSAGGADQNVVITPSGSGAFVSNANIMSNGSIAAKGKIFSEEGLNIKGLDGYSGTVTQISSLKFEGALLQKKEKTLTITSGIITAVSGESEWTDVGSPKF